MPGGYSTPGIHRVPHDGHSAASPALANATALALALARTRTRTRTRRA
ncbi:hypothetical protein AB0F77_22825 [Streptomyces sp. NPDC026672]